MENFKNRGYFPVRTLSNLKVIQKDLVIQVTEKLPDNFYVYVPATDVGDEKKDGPAFIMTNKTVYPFIYVFNKDK